MLLLLICSCDPGSFTTNTEQGQVTSISKPRFCYGYEITINEDKTFIIRMNLQDLSKLRWKWVEYTYTTEPVCITQKQITSIHETSR